MKHRPDLKTLRIAALAAMLAPTAAMAQIQTYYRSGTWEAFSGRNDKGGAVCGIDNTNPSDNRRMSIRFDIGGSDTVLSASKPDWAIPDGTRITVVMQIGLNTPWTRSATGYGNSSSKHAAVVASMCCCGNTPITRKRLRSERTACEWVR